jgi:hypothetical protein
VRRKLAEHAPELDVPRVNPTILLIAALPFLVVFVKLWMFQYYPTLLVLPFYAVACAALVVALLSANRRLLKYAGAALCAALLVNSAIDTLTFRKAFFSRAAIAQLKSQLDTLSAPGQYILVNHMWDSAYGYYFDRNTVSMLLQEPSRFNEALSYYTDARRTHVAPPSGAIFVQHKHLADELYDKGFYYILAQHALWAPWANPDHYHAEIDAFVAARDSALVADVARIGEKIDETDFYTIWRIKPHAPGDSTRVMTGSVARVSGQTHLAKVER